jgi:hypothetical protein
LGFGAATHRVAILVEGITLLGSDRPIGLVRGRTHTLTGPCPGDDRKHNRQGSEQAGWQANGDTAS